MVPVEGSPPKLLHSHIGAWAGGTLTAGAPRALLVPPCGLPSVAKLRGAQGSRGAHPDGETDRQGSGIHVAFHGLAPAVTTTTDALFNF